MYEFQFNEVTKQRIDFYSGVVTASSINLKLIKMYNAKIESKTPLAMLTVGQFMELVNNSKEQPKEQAEPAKKYVYGLKGIRELFNVSHATAQRYKDTIIKDAVKQCGRKIIVDAEHAIELFNHKNF